MVIPSFHGEDNHSDVICYDQLAMRAVGFAYLPKEKVERKDTTDFHANFLETMQSGIA